MPRIVRFRDLEPSWATRQATEPGFMRWLVTWLGGPRGFINTNPGTAIENAACAVGLMYLPRGQRQSGKHIHGVTEIYVVLQGELESFDASDQPHRAGPMDCTYIPAGCPHGVRNCGLDDVVLIWVHDGIERNGTAVYYPDDHVFSDPPRVQLVPFADLEPDWSGPGARTPGTMRWSVSWAAGLPGSPARAAPSAAANSKVAVGMTVLEPGHSQAAEMLAISRLYVVAAGEAITSLSGATLGYLDGLHVPAGEAVALRNNGPAPLRLLWVDAPSG